MDTPGIFATLVTLAVILLGAYALFRALAGDVDCHHGAHPADAYGRVHLDRLVFVAVDTPDSPLRSDDTYGQHWTCTRCGATWHRMAMRAVPPSDVQWADLVMDAVCSTDRPAVVVPPPGSLVYLRGPQDGPAPWGALTPA